MQVLSAAMMSLPMPASLSTATVMQLPASAEPSRGRVSSFCCSRFAPLPKMQITETLFLWHAAFRCCATARRVEQSNAGLRPPATALVQDRTPVGDVLSVASTRPLHSRFNVPPCGRRGGHCRPVTVFDASTLLRATRVLLKVIGRSPPEVTQQSPCSHSADGSKQKKTRRAAPCRNPNRKRTIDHESEHGAILPT